MGRIKGAPHTKESKYRMILRVVQERDDEECWEWEGSTIKGYGCLYSIIKGGTVYAHIVAYEARYGPVPEGLELDHECRNPPCWNPRHVIPVTHQENVACGLASSSEIRSRASSFMWWRRSLQRD